jgi:hypothetical protein
MPHKRGAHLGGAKRLWDLRERCVIDSETSCWHIRDAHGRPLKRDAGQDVWLHGVGLVSVCRAAWTLATKETPPEGHKVWRVCQSYDCINPAHLRCWTRVEYGQWVRQSGHLRGKVHRSVANRASGAPKKKLTDELVQWALDSSQGQRETADALQVSPALISHIRTGRKRKQQAASSAFTWRP